MAVERKFVKEAVNRLLVKDFVQQETQRAGYGGLDIQRTPLGTASTCASRRRRESAYSARPSSSIPLG